MAKPIGNMLKKDTTTIGTADNEYKAHQITASHMMRIDHMLGNTRKQYSREFVVERIHYLLDAINHGLVNKDCRDRALSTILHLERGLV